MLKKILSTFIAIYIVISVMYLGYVLFPKFNSYLNNFDFSNNVETKKKETIKEEEKTTIQLCKNYSLGYINSDNNFSTGTRIKNTFDESLRLINNTLSHNIEDISCDIVGNRVLIFFNSKLYSDAIVSNYEYTSPVSKNLKNKLELKTLLKSITLYGESLDSGYIVAVYNIDNANLKDVEWNINKDEEELLLGTCDTIFFETTGKNPGRTQVEYIAAKTDVNNDNIDDLFILNYWDDKTLAKDERYISIFVMLINKDTSAKRYTLLPFKKIKKANYHIEQIVDIDNDSYKEFIVRVAEGFNDTFLIYDYSKNLNSFIEVK